ncbi:MAG: diacylglycerol kinase family protein [Acidobacteriota bacterium]
MPATSVEVIINAASGLGYKEEMRDQLAGIFSASNIEAKISLARSGAEIQKFAQRAAGSNAQVVVAGGGDGTINSIASLLVDTDKVLGVLPLGTLNHFAKDLHIPLELVDAARTIISGDVVRVDVGEVNGRIFLNNSSLGLYPSIVSERVKQQKLGWGKWPAFVWAGIAVLRRYPFLHVRLSVDGREFHSRTPFVFIGNNEYEMESLHIGSRPSLNAGKLSLYITNRTGRVGLIRLAWRALFGGLTQEKDFRALGAKELWIETRHKGLRVARDGEVSVMTPPMHYRVRPLSLRVLVPQSRQVTSE